MVEYPDEWLAYDNVPKDMKETFDTMNGNRKYNKGQKKLKSSSGGVTARTNKMIQQIKVEAQMFLHANICLSNIHCPCVFSCGSKTQTAVTKTC